jgi:hypothetical protein
MAAATTWTFTNEGRTKLQDGTLIPGTDTFKMALHASTGTQPSPTTTLWSGLSTSEIAAANGYTAGGTAITITLSGTTTLTVDSTDGIWTASGGPLSARWAVIYEVGGHVLCYSKLDSADVDVSCADGQQLKVEIAAAGLYTLT